MPRRAVEGGRNFPEDGDIYEDDLDPVDPPTPPDDPPAPRPDPAVAELTAKLEKQQRELDELRARTPPPTPKPTPAPAPAADEFNYDEELFRNPKKTLERFGNEVAERVTKQLTGQYQRDRSTQKFWEEFYEKHPDLKADHDLVEVTLSSNLSKLAAVQVPEAIERLAELTRDRILRYAGDAAKSRPKARAEGAKGTISPAPPVAPDEPKILSISQMLKKRREDRRKKAAGV